MLSYYTYNIKIKAFLLLLCIVCDQKSLCVDGEGEGSKSWVSTLLRNPIAQQIAVTIVFNYVFPYALKQSTGLYCYAANKENPYKAEQQAEIDRRIYIASERAQGERKVQQEQIKVDILKQERESNKIFMIGERVRQLNLLLEYETDPVKKEILKKELEQLTLDIWQNHIDQTRIYFPAKTA